MNNLTLKCYKIAEDVPDLHGYATEDSACFDLQAYLENQNVLIYDEHNMKIETKINSKWFNILPKARVLIPTGYIFDIPEGFSLRIHPRSGTALKLGLMLGNCEGVVDSDYVNQSMIMVYNGSNTTIQINHGDRIAQAELVPVYKTNFEYISEAPSQKTSRNGGWGSTGVNKND